MNINLARIKAGLTQKKLAELVGTSNVTILKMEKGNINSVKFGTLKKISEILGVPLIELID